MADQSKLPPLDVHSFSTHRDVTYTKEAQVPIIGENTTFFVVQLNGRLWKVQVPEGFLEDYKKSIYLAQTK